MLNPSTLNCRLVRRVGNRLLPLITTVVVTLLSNGPVAAQSQSPAAVEPATTVRLNPGPGVQYDLQTALINAIPGDTIELGAGVFHFDTELNVAADNVTIRGAGQDKTILSFRKQGAGSSGIVATGNAFVIEHLAVEDTVGNAIKVLGARDVTFRGVRVEWTRGPDSGNGAYGIYPVECRNVLVEDCLAIGASDAGIYVGQSQDVVVKGCTARQNVAGIEIENTLRADVFDNVATDNAGGILIFDLPGLTLTNGGHVRVFRNQVNVNNQPNFAPKGTMVADVPSGTGVMLMGTDHVEIFDNDIADNQTSNVVVVSFLITERRIGDPKYDPFPEAFAIHDNRIHGGGRKPTGQIGVMLAPVLGVPFPDIFYDGLLNPEKIEDGELPVALRPQITGNGDARFVNVNIGRLSVETVASGEYEFFQDLEPYNIQRTPITPVTLKPHAAPQKNGNPAVAVYRSAPRRLSEWNLFADGDHGWQAADDVLPYELNTPLFSDHTTKHRFIRLPDGAQIAWASSGSLEFPIGTVIAKSFAYPDASNDKTVGERFLETRIELREAAGWYGYSYVWNAEQTDAELRLGGGVVDVAWRDASGTEQTNHYQIPNANQCLSCHSQDGHFVPIGTTAANLNRAGGDRADADRPNHDNQLAAWIAHGHLRGAPPVTDQPKLAVFDDPSSGSVTHRARAWLDVNCAHCHSPGGSARTSGLDLRVAQTDAAKYGVFKSPVATGQGSGGRRYDIVPGKPDESILMFRLESTDPGARMPNLARNLLHPESNTLIREWIASMPSESR